MRCILILDNIEGIDNHGHFDGGIIPKERRIGLIMHQVEIPVPLLEI